MNNDNVWNSKEKNYKLDFLDTSSENVTEDEILDYLARIISEIYLSELGKNEAKSEEV